jgi:hypothetical protein
MQYYKHLFYAYLQQTKLYSEAGAGARHSVGTEVIVGMLAATFLATFLSPLFCYWLTDRMVSDKTDSKLLLQQAIEHNEYDNEARAKVNKG